MRLRHSNASGRGYRRVRAGTGFSYRDLDGSTLPPGPVRERLESIGIPPAWTDVWIAPFDNGHIQATGLDAVGRRQYIYHPEWRERKDRREIRPRAPARRVAAHRPPAGHHGSEVRRRHPRSAFWPPPSGCWTAGSLRVGSERYTNENGSHGLATLLCAHVHGPQGLPAAQFPGQERKNLGVRHRTTPTSPRWPGR